VKRVGHVSTRGVGESLTYLSYFIDKSCVTRKIRRTSKKPTRSVDKQRFRNTAQATGEYPRGGGNTLSSRVRFEVDKTDANWPRVILTIILLDSCLSIQNIVVRMKIHLGTMTNNEHTQLPQNSVHRRYSTANVVTTGYGVRQDKGVPTFDRIASH